MWDCQQLIELKYSVTHDGICIIIWMIDCLRCPILHGEISSWLGESIQHCRQLVRRREDSPCLIGCYQLKGIAKCIWILGVIEKRIDCVVRLATCGAEGAGGTGNRRAKGASVMNSGFPLYFHLVFLVLFFLSLWRLCLPSSLSQDLPV